MIMQLEHISKSFGGRQLFHDVTFRLEEYERLALVGPNGAGKTTMLNIISGAEDPDEGRVLFAKGARVGYLEQEAIEMADQPIFEEVMSSQVEVLEAERRLHKLEAELGEAPTPQQLAAAGRVERAQVGHVLVRERELVHEVGQLRHAARDGVAALERVVAKVHVEAGLRVALAGLPIALRHGELVQVSQQRVVDLHSR